MCVSGWNSPAHGRSRGSEIVNCRLPAIPQQIIRVRRHADGLVPPVGQSVKRADAEPAETGGVGALRRFEPPVEIPLRPGGVHVRINFAVVSFLINHQPVRARRDERTIIRRFHRPDFERNARPVGVQRGDAVAQIIVRDKFRMFARDEQDVAEALFLAAPAPRACTSSSDSVTRRIGLSREKPQ